MRLLTATFLMIFISTAAMALTLEEAIDLALKNNDSVKQQQMQARGQIYSSRAAIAPFLPQVGVEYRYTDTEGRSAAFEVQSSNLTLQVAYNLFNGFGDISRYLAASAMADAQQFTYEGAKQDIVLTVKTVYISYLKARNALEVAESMMKLLEAQKRTAEVSFNIGQFSRADVLRVDVQLASTQLDLLNARINRKLARQQLERYVGRAIPESEHIEEVAIQEAYDLPSMDKLLKMMEDNRSEMQLIKLVYDSAKWIKYSAVSGFLPKVNLFYNYGWDSDGTNPFDGMPLSADPNRPNSDGTKTVGISASWNFFSGFYDTHNFLAQSKNANAAAFAVTDLRKTLRLQLSDAYENYFSARERLMVATVGLEQAQESHRVTQSQYENGEATTTDLLNANVALSQAMTSYAGANYDIITALAQLERAVETKISEY